MHVEASTTESFADIVRVVSAEALPDSDFTAKAPLEGLPLTQAVSAKHAQGEPHRIVA